jgi:hypothetical protein
MGGVCSMYGEKIKAYRIKAGKSLSKRKNKTFA